MRVYLDHNATAPLRPEARTAMIAAMDVVGNPSSVHGEGRAAKAVIERAPDDFTLSTAHDSDPPVASIGSQISTDASDRSGSLE